MKSFSLYGSIVDKKTIDAIAASQEAINMVIPATDFNKLSDIPLATRQELLETILTAYDVPHSIIKAHRSAIFANIRSNILQAQNAIPDTTSIYAGTLLEALIKSEPSLNDGIKTLQSNKKLIKIRAREYSVLYMTGRYHRAQNNNNNALMQRMRDGLTQYLGDVKIADIYLNNNRFKQDAERYLSTLTIQDGNKTVDNIITKELNGETYVLLGKRAHFPIGWAGMGGFIDEEDATKAKAAGIPNKEIYAALREGIEELGGGDEASDKAVFGNEKTTDGMVYYVQLGDKRLEIRVDELLNDNLYKDDLSSMTEPSDPRMPVHTHYFLLRVVSGNLEASSDVGSIQRFKATDILEGKVEIVMPHHHVIYNKVLGSK